MQNGYARGRPPASFASNGRVRDELLNETLLMSMAHARVEIAAWVDDYNRERSHSSFGYATPAAFAAELDKQWPTSTAPFELCYAAHCFERACAKQPPGSNPSWGKTWGHVTRTSKVVE